MKSPHVSCQHFAALEPPPTLKPRERESWIGRAVQQQQLESCSTEGSEGRPRPDNDEETNLVDAVKTSKSKPLSGRFNLVEGFWS